MSNKKIFIQIAAYRDPQLIPTIKDCLSKAKYPQNLVFAIAWQHSTQDEWDNLYEFKDDPRFKILDIDYLDSQGACWARNKLQEKYNGEKYTLQLDSHHRFIQDWDDELIKMYEGLKKDGVKKPLLTGYVPSFNPENDPAERVMTPWKMNFDRFIPEGAVFFLPASIDNFKELSKPVPARFYSAHFCFTSGSFVKEVPHDPEYYFHGEEISIAVRAFTWGYDLFHPHKVIVWHEYTRKGRTKQWDDDTNWVEKNNKSHLRNRKLFEMDGLVNDIDFGKYGFGTERTVLDYEKYAGISFKRRAVQKYTLDNNLAPNPVLSDEEFDKSFMRIFKHCIDIYKGAFKENDYDFWAVIFENIDGVQLNRKDLTPSEIENALNTKGDFVNIWRSFDVDENPRRWIVWPHSKSKGWCDKSEGVL
jgi:hypothetical protein